MRATRGSSPSFDRFLFLKEGDRPNSMSYSSDFGSPVSRRGISSAPSEAVDSPPIDSSAVPRSPLGFYERLRAQGPRHSICLKPAGDLSRQRVTPGLIIAECRTEGAGRPTVCHAAPAINDKSEFSDVHRNCCSTAIREALVPGLEST